MLRAIQYIYVLRPVWAVLAALLVGAGLIAVAGVNPWDAYGALFGGAFLDYYGLASTLAKMSPILLAGLAVIVPLRVPVVCARREPSASNMSGVENKRPFVFTQQKWNDHEQQFV